MKKHKKLFGLLLAICLIVGCLPMNVVAVDAHVGLGSIEYVKNNNGTVTIKKCATGARGILEIPTTIDGGTVTSIAAAAFKDCDQITQVTIPSTVTSIGDSAFQGCKSLTGIVIPDSVTELGSRAFERCTALKSAVVGKGVKALPTACFQSCYDLSQVSLSDGLETIGYDTFEHCTSLTSIDLPDTLKTLDIWAFAYTGLTGVTMPSSMRDIKLYAFAYCKNLKYVTLNDGLKTIGDSAFIESALQTLVIPDSVTTVNGYAFARISTLRSVTVGSGVQTIQSTSFLECPNLETIIIREGVKTIEGSSFLNSASLKTLYLPSSLVEIRPTCFKASNNIRDIYYAGTAYGWGGVAIGKDNGNILGDDVTMHYVPFKDTKAGEYYYEPMVWAIDMGITNGTSDTTFSPNQICTQSQILTFLYRAVGSPAVSGGSAYSNSKISPDKYYYKAMLWAYQQGVVTDLNLDPDEACTRADVVTYLWRLDGKPAARGSNFSDVPASADYAQAVNWAVRENITTGTSDTTFSPDVICSRSQIVTFLYRAFAK